VLAGEFGIGPDIARGGGVGGHSPFVVGGFCGDERFIHAAGFVVPSEAIFLLIDALGVDGPGVGDAITVGKPIVQWHGDAGGSFRSEKIEAVSMVDVSALETHVVEIGTDHAGIGDGLDGVVVGGGAIDEVVVKADAIEFGRGAGNQVNGALQIHFVFERVLAGATPRGMSVLRARAENVKVYCVGFAVLAGGDVFGEKDADARVGSGLAGQKDF